MPISFHKLASINSLINGLNMNELSNSFQIAQKGYQIASFIGHSFIKLMNKYFTFAQPKFCYYEKNAALYPGAYIDYCWLYKN